MKQQKSVRTQMLQLANQLDKSSHNLTAFKRRKSIAVNSTHKFMNQTLSTETVQSKVRHHSAEKSICALLGHSKVAKHTQGGRGSRRKKPHITDDNNGGFLNKRRKTTNFTQAVNKSIGNAQAMTHSKLQAVNSNNSSFPSQQKQVFKNRSLSDSVLEEWINRILMERCPQQHFDMTLGKGALKRFEIDKNSLLAEGISEKSVSRILKSLFVYSIGFNNLLAELGKDKVKVKKNLWRVFSVLVEYCSEGSLATVLSTIEKQNKAEMQVICGELQKHKEMIESNEVMMRQKSDKVFCENKDLRFKAELLQMDRNILKQSLEDMERALKEEVSLRVRFEDKISDLHNLHRELQIKHYKLFSDLQLKNNELVYFKDKSTYYYTENIRIKKELAAIENTLTEKDTACRLALEQTAKLTKELAQKSTYDAQRRIEKKISENVIRQKEIIEGQLISKLKNMESAVQCRQKSYKQLHQSYSEALQENKRLVNKFNSQMLDLAFRLEQQKESTLSNSQYLSEIQLLSAKLKQKMQALAQLDHSLHLNLNQMEDLSVELQTKMTANELLEKALQQANHTISKLKDTNQNLQESNHQIEIINEMLSSKFKQVDEQLPVYKESSAKWKLKYDSCWAELEKYKVTSAILSEQVPKLQQGLRASKEAFQRSRILGEERVRKLEGEIVQKTVELDKVKAYYCNIEEKFKNEQFQRKNILIQYKHLLNAYEQLSDVIKEQAKRISQSQRQFQEASLQLKIAKMQYESLERAHRTQLEEKDKKFKQFELSCKISPDLISPMLLEDALSHFLRLAARMQAIEEARYSQGKDRQALFLKLQEQSVKFSEEQRQRSAEFEEEMKRKELELQYQQKKSKLYMEKIEHLQLVLIAKDMKVDQGQIPKQKEHHYLEVISNSNLKVNTLMDQLQSIANYNQQLARTVQTNSHQISTLSQQLAHLAQQNQHLLNINEQLGEQVESLKSNQESLIRQLAQKEEWIHNLQDLSQERQASSKKGKRSRQKSPSAKAKANTKQVYFKPMVVEGEQRQRQMEDKSEVEKKMFKTEGWREDLAHKLKNTFDYYS